MHEVLKELGINIGLSVAGLFGSLVMVGKTSAYELKKTSASILAGVAAANYLTPIATAILSNIDIENYKFAVAFLLGFLGLKGIELMVDRLVKKK
jgi:hypothetical protein